MTKKEIQNTLCDTKRKKKRKRKKHERKLIPSSAPINRISNDTIEVSPSILVFLSLIPVAPPHCIIVYT